MAQPANLKPTGSSGRISFYFVLYLVAIISVFVITMERDTLLRKRDDDIAHLVEIYLKPLHLTAAVDTTRYFLPANREETAEPLKLLAKADGPIDRNDIQYTLLSIRKVEGTESDTPALDGATFANEQGDGVLSFPHLGAGVYEFVVAGYKPRVIRRGDIMRVAIRDTTYEIPYSDRLAHIDRDTAVLVASVVKSGIEPTQLVVSTDQSRETWVVGPPYSKKIFVGGVESPEHVTFNAGQFHVERTRGERAFVTLVWDRPTIGVHPFTITALGNRGLGEKDRASVSFAVEVLPATFTSNPPHRAFWGIPYVFDGGIVGVNPVDLSVEFTRNGAAVWTRPAVPKDTVLPDRSWLDMTFKILYHGIVVKEHRASVEAPPPPQIRWVKQELDHASNTLLVTVNCTDPAGGPVRMSLESQPGGLARLDRVHGTSFTITVNTDGALAGIFLKLTAVDQYGGQANSSRQFSLQ